MSVPMSKNYFIPEVDSNYVPFGFFNDLKNIISSRKFYPIYVFGESGFGKNIMVEQVCAKLKRELVRFNCSPETDQSSLLGGPTLVNGNIEYKKGPVIEAMENGYVLLLDEFAKSHAGNSVILNSILEGNAYYNPYTTEYIHPKEGFNIIAASNSAGRGEDTGRYLEQIMDSSLLERFPITVVQDEPTDKILKLILSKYLEDEDFIEKLVKWFRVIIKTYRNGAIDEMISIRRLVHIAKTYGIFANKLKSITLCTNRFDEHIKLAFIDLYQKIDANIEVEEIEV